MAVDKKVQRRLQAAAKKWIRNSGDEKAIAAGCGFSEDRGRAPIEFAERYLRLYEGDFAGQPLIPRDWQVEVTMRLFGWVRWSERLGRWVRRFTRGGIWVPKKNKKSPTLAWWGLFLLCADGEMGQKVYFAAKDGSQAREIAGKHAVEMVLSSPELLAECEINKAIMQVTHLTSRSILKPLTSGDKRTQQSKEGLNGSILVDETHVVDRAFMDRISRAGISRAEPLQIEVSTAGNDPDGYGKEQFDYGQSVERGDIEDQGFLFASYAAPQELTDEQLAGDPIKFGKLANPAWGHTIQEEEFLDDYTRSTVSISKLALFKMYRLNVWQQSTNPWLSTDDWKRCQISFREEDLLGRICFGGLDLAKTRDMCAWALVFPMPELGPEVHRLLTYFFLPESAARKNADKVPFLRWAQGGHLILTPGDVCDYSFLRQRILADHERFRIQEYRYDPYNAEQLTQEMEMSHGLRRVLFPQTIVNFAEPSSEFERLVISGKLQHAGHPIMNWEIGHVRVKTDMNANMRPVKPGVEDLKKIDGVVAGIMALAGSMANPDLGDPAVILL